MTAGLRKHIAVLLLLLLQMIGSLDLYTAVNIPSQQQSTTLSQSSLQSPSTSLKKIYTALHKNLTEAIEDSEAVKKDTQFLGQACVAVLVQFLFFHFYPQTEKLSYSEQNHLASVPHVGKYVLFSNFRI